MATPGQPTTQPPLTGIEVVELANMIATPAATHLLATQGASVVKVENADTGDDVLVATLADGRTGAIRFKSYQPTRRELARGNHRQRPVAIDANLQLPDVDAGRVPAAVLMHDKKISGLPVVDDGKCVGMLTVQDLMEILVAALDRHLNEVNEEIREKQLGPTAPGA